MPPRSTLVLTTALMLAFVGCAGDRPTPPALPDAPGPRAAPELADLDVTAAVSRVLSVDRAARGANVHVRVAEGLVELVGDVLTLRSRRRMTDLAEAVRGVRGVSNRLTVRESDRRDALIEDDVRKVLVLDPVAELFEVIPSVRDAVVRLDGVTQSWVERRIAEDVVGAVAGVRAVDNRITLTPVSRPDDAIAEDVRTELRWDAVVRDQKVVVWVRDGVVELSGLIGSAAEKSRAILLAHTDGVTRVDADELEVSWRLSRTDLRRDDTGAVPDVELRKAIQAGLRRNPRLRHFGLRVRVNEGCVMLEGVVDNLRAARLAEDLAASTFGVRKIDSAIEVRPTALADDETLRELLELALTLDAATSGMPITVNVEAGRVVLTGSAPDRDLGSEAERVATGIRGVIAVEDALSVAPLAYAMSVSPRTAAALVPTNVVYRSADEQRYRSDAEIESAIEQALAWAAGLDAASIEVGVSAGRATLAGEVDDLLDRRAAEAIARASGASEVVNRLRLFAGVPPRPD